VGQSIPGKKAKAGIRFSPRVTTRGCTEKNLLLQNYKIIDCRHIAIAMRNLKGYFA
jgi:hypothetical protein